MDFIYPEPYLLCVVLSSHFPVLGS
uniref:Uncharacterized protein n=1 Tax=Arundo donax TaxID=35708 RepID=A0A0A9F6I6_ARUDO